jgi:hypothetical protein
LFVLSGVTISAGEAKTVQIGFLKEDCHEVLEPLVAIERVEPIPQPTIFLREAPLQLELELTIAAYEVAVGKQLGPFEVARVEVQVVVEGLLLLGRFEMVRDQLSSLDGAVANVEHWLSNITVLILRWLVDFDVGDNTDDMISGFIDCVKLHHHGFFVAQLTDTPYNLDHRRVDGGDSRLVRDVLAEDLVVDHSASDIADSGVVVDRNLLL